MSVNELRSLVTLLSFVSFVGIVIWVFAPRRQTYFDEAAAHALNDEGASRAQPKNVVNSSEVVRQERFDE
jgi:cytochrome c oxidase cbb3-type subunit 4